MAVSQTIAAGTEFALLGCITTPADAAGMVALSAPRRSRINGVLWDIDRRKNSKDGYQGTETRLESKVDVGFNSLAAAV